MKKIFISIILSFLFLQPVFAQNTRPGKLKVFIDCNGTWCDMQYIRSEINIVDFLLDNAAADVHVLITSQNTGSGGEQYQLIFFGQQQFKNQADTLRFTNGPNATEFEVRDLLLKYLKAGLIPYIARTAAAINMDIRLKTTDTAAQKSSATVSEHDPWNYWVMRLGLYGNTNADANYKNTSYTLDVSANRITNELKTGGGLYWSKNKATFSYDVNGQTEKFIVNNHRWNANHYLVKSINQHWSWAYEVKYSQATFSNNKGRLFGRVAAEYDIFPYKDVNTKLLTFSYGFTARSNRYYDTTIYDKLKETLFAQSADAYLTLNQKWGTSYVGISYQNYLHDWKLFNLGIDIYTNVRITGGLSFFISAFGGLTRNQVFLVKGNATPEEVLARRRQLASGYFYYSSIGINYRFGSKLNNFVNPRFDRSSSSSDD